MARATFLPSILSPQPPNSAISMERALKQAYELIEGIKPNNGSHEDKILATLDDLEVMLGCVKRED